MKHVFRVGDIADLTAKLAALTALKLGEAERLVLKNDNARRYDWTDIAAKTAATYRELIEAGRREPPARIVPTVATASDGLTTLSEFPSKMVSTPAPDNAGR
jgi:hypothetical protein